SVALRSPPRLLRRRCTRSLHDALPICVALARAQGRVCVYLEPIALYHRRDLYDDGDDLWLGRQDPSVLEPGSVETYGDGRDVLRSEEHTSELQSREKLACRLLLAKQTT